MDTDLLLAAGLVLLALSLLVLLSAWSDSQLSPFGLVVLVVAGGLIGWAIYAAPEPYRLQDIPTVLLGVLARAIQ